MNIFFLKVAATGAILALVVGFIIRIIGPYPGKKYETPLIVAWFLPAAAMVLGLIAAIWVPQ